jgi:hypothetical protein
MTTRDDLRPAKSSIIHEMFLHTADENYIVARWCFDNQLMTDFFWNAVHALEKYLKAVLLFNDISVSSFSHGLAPLYEEVEKLAGPLLPTVLAQPATLDIYHWVDLTPRAFLEKLDRNGNADNRYLTYGFAQHPWYLHMVDAMVWAIRRLAIRLDMPIFSQREVPGAPTYRDILTQRPDYAHGLSTTLDRVINGDDSPKRRALLNNNNAFAPASYEHESRPAGASARNPILLRRIIDPLRSGRAENARHGYRMGTWLLANTRQSKPVRDEIVAAMKAALAQHPGIDQPTV